MYSWKTKVEYKANFASGDQPDLNKRIVTGLTTDISVWLSKQLNVTQYAMSTRMNLLKES